MGVDFGGIVAAGHGPLRHICDAERAAADTSSVRVQARASGDANAAANVKQINVGGKIERVFFLNIGHEARLKTSGWRGVRDERAAGWRRRRKEDLWLARTNRHAAWLRERAGGKRRTMKSRAGWLLGQGESLMCAAPTWSGLICPAWCDAAGTGALRAECRLPAHVRTIARCSTRTCPQAAARRRAALARHRARAAVRS